VDRTPKQTGIEDLMAQSLICLGSYHVGHVGIAKAEQIIRDRLNLHTADILSLPAQRNHQTGSAVQAQVARQWQTIAPFSLS